ncbi:oncostatin-M [Orycteropus afer afer]|uniref:Oncostatin-M n=1 Tax=Orycteropus afer afer TaxID=1230840 RepID=A0AC54Z4L9_ORYAF|nr:oncostatin-M [Orycteropus afer afer]
MWVQLTQRTQLGLVLGLLLLCTEAIGVGPSEYKAFYQLQQQARILKDTSKLLEPYMRIQGLDNLDLKGACKERPGAFPGVEALQKLSKQGFLQTLNATVSLVLHRLAACQQAAHLTTESQDWKELCFAERYLLGIRNNIVSLTRLLNGSSETAATPRVDPGALPPPTLSQDSFQVKLDGCKFLQGFHHFMSSVAHVSGKWAEPPRRNRRHSPCWALRGRARRMRPALRGQPHGTRPSRKAKRPVLRRLLPR